MDGLFILGSSRLTNDNYAGVLCFGKPPKCSSHAASGDTVWLYTPLHHGVTHDQRPPPQYGLSSIYVYVHIRLQKYFTGVFYKISGSLATASACHQVSLYLQSPPSGLLLLCALFHSPKLPKDLRLFHESYRFCG